MNFCFIPWINWDSYLHSRPHQLVKEALRRGHRVLYLNPGSSPSFRDKKLEVWHPLSHPLFGVAKRILRGELFKKDGSSVMKLTPMRRLVYRPYEGRDGWTFLSRHFIEFIIIRKLREFHDPRGKNIILFEQPFAFVHQIPTLKRMGYTVVYDMIDDWSAYRDAPGYFRETEPFLLKHAHLVTATARLLYEKARRYNRNVHLCPNAADLEHFLTARRKWDRPGDLPEGRPIAGFFGIMREWFDSELVRAVAQNKPQFEFCLIGGYSPEVFDRLKGLGNVRLLGEKPYSVLPQYLSHFEAALIPFKTDDLIRSTNPIKVYEYLAGGKPVVTTDIPEVEHMPSVYLSKDREEFIRNLERATQSRMVFNKIDHFLSNQTWAKRFDVIEMALAKLNVV